MKRLPRLSLLGLVVALVACESPGRDDGAAPATSAATAATTPATTPNPTTGPKPTTAPAASPEPAPKGMVTVPGGELRSCVWVRREAKLSPSCVEAERAVIAAFALDRTEVTTARYADCVAAGACTTEGFAGSRCNWSARTERGDHPINCVTHAQAARYCRWANKRLPTASEWERAARGPANDVFVWGTRRELPESMPLGGESDQPEELRRALGTGHCWRRVGTCSVDAAGPANAFGLIGMAGNVTEWVDGGALDDSRLERFVSPEAREQTWRARWGTSWSDPPVDDTHLLVLAQLRLSPDGAAGEDTAGFRCAR